MALNVKNVGGRPEKTLSDGFLSRFNGSRTPLIYKFENDLFPTNQVDPTATVTALQ